MFLEEIAKSKKDQHFFQRLRNDEKSKGRQASSIVEQSLSSWSNESAPQTLFSGAFKVFAGAV